MLKIRYNGVQGLYFLRCVRRLLPFSTSSSSTPDSFANYLVEALGFSKQQSLSTSAKLTHLRRARGAKNEVSDSTFVAKSNSVATFLTQIGLTKSNIRSIVNSDPQILLSDVHKTLEPKLKILLDLGLPMSDIGLLISTNPSILRSRLKPAIEDLKQVLDSDEKNVVRILMRHMWYNIPTAVKYLITNVELLENYYGIPREKLLKHILCHPNTFASKPENFRVALLQVEQKLGIPRRSRMFCYGILVMVNLSEKTIDSKVGVFKSFGWTESDVRQMVKRFPHCLLMSEERIKRSLQFFVNELGYDPAYIAGCTSLFTCSLEKRIVPRYRILEVLKEKGFVKMDYSLYSVICMSEPKFFDKYVKPFKDVMPNLYEVYVSNKSCPPILPTQGRADSHSQQED